MRYYITRAINGVTINGKEFVLTKTGRAKYFATRKGAEAFLLAHNYTKKQVGHGVYIEKY